MNLVEAVRSGQPFKRPHYDYWIIVNPDGFAECKKEKLEELAVLSPYIEKESGTPVIFAHKAVIADDWIVFAIISKDKEL